MKHISYSFSVILTQVAKPNVRLSPPGRMLSNVSSLAALLKSVLAFAFGFIGVLSIISLVFSIILYTTAGGDEGRVGEAGRFFGYFLVGMIISFVGIWFSGYIKNILG